VTSARLGALLSLVVLGLGCEAVLGAEFDDFGPFPPDASSEWPPLDANAPDPNAHDGGADDVGPVDEGHSSDEIEPPPPDTGPPGGCVPGEVKAIGACGNCGQYWQICNEGNTWNPHFCQQESQACSPGWREQRACNGNGTLTATCTEKCIWSLGDCVSSNCLPDETDEQECGFCGMQKRTCQPVGDAGGREWTPFSVCMNTKACAPDTVEGDICGNCGKRSRRCEGSCTWAAWTTCQEEGVCEPGTREMQACVLGLLGRQTRTCSDSCQWGMFGPCM